MHRAESRPHRWACFLMQVLALSASATAIAHHTYSMYDQNRRVSVTGTVARLEWRNPHAFIWVYVPSKDNPGKHDLYAFENGSPTVLAKQGWSRDSLPAGVRVTVEFSPLRDGSNGGHCLNVTLADGKVLACAGAGSPPAPVVVNP